MNHADKRDSVVSDELWRFWAAKGRQKQRANARKATAVAAIALVVLILGAELIVLAVK